MRSTFSGLETARRAMFTQQGALKVTGHNIANANTPGYTRQRANFQQTEPYPNAAINRPNIPGQVGTGVEAGSIQRVREAFLDTQYRGESNKLGYWETKMQSYKKMEEVMNEPSEAGLSRTMDQFWESLQDLAVNPTNEGARSVVRQRGIALAETFNYLSSTLTSVRTDMRNELDVSVKQVNSLMQQIHNVNEQIADVEPHGYLPNDLYDERDRLIDELSSMINVQVTYESNGGQSSNLAEGRAIVRLTGDGLTPSATLVGKGGYNTLSVNYQTTGAQAVESLQLGSLTIDAANFKSTGKVQALMESYGYVEGTGVTGDYTKMLSELDAMAYVFAQKFNQVHADGLSPNEINNGTTDPIQFFVDDVTNDFASATQEGFASRIKISQDIVSDLANIATATATNPTLGNPDNVQLLANVINVDKLAYDGVNNATFRSHFESVIGEMAVSSQNAVRLATNTSQLKLSVDERRQAVSSVSLDEEMTNMIQFQHAYNAAARMITLQDELLDRVINGMGTVGR
ncbi:flagellar hook-associated protein FlgK [Mangrovibacillus cuniculi]|uniref:Flagellar hook-associated protein 1 n=1 Tax=Mangrovibacillus cuniculi TaxID=2593652 RepID=A0A7S8CCL0_9BACI|nr:flagellar hook-associated protein FlgK [Mangrovibacillus cuniculi]QPC47515.1 flagellar hook-associated protein FlgK [Mangrovibacillus cuniculi]